MKWPCCSFLLKVLYPFHFFPEVVIYFMLVKLVILNRFTAINMFVNTHLTQASE